MPRYEQTPEGLPAVGSVRALGCEHAYPLRPGDAIHSLLLDPPLGFRRVDGSHGEAQLLILCHGCRRKLVGKMPNMSIEHVPIGHEGLWDNARGWVNEEG